MADQRGPAEPKLNVEETLDRYITMETVREEHVAAGYCSGVHCAKHPHVILLFFM